MEKKAETPTAARVRELLDRARNHAYDARIRRTTDESVLRAIDALAEAVAVLVADNAVPQKTL